MTGVLDIGQAVVVKNGRVVAIEAAEGTDAMLERVATIAGISSKRGGVFLKSAQIDQDERVYMPTIGIETIKNIIKANDNFISNFPGTKFREESMYTKFISSYQIAINSIILTIKPYVI